MARDASRGCTGRIGVTGAKEVGVRGIQIGQLLVEQGVLTSEQVRHILTVQRASSRPFGDLAERLFGVSPEAVEDAWVEQYVRMAGTVDLADIDVDTECLLNGRQAWQFQLLPVGRGDDGSALEMVTTAEGLVRAVNFSSRAVNEPVHFLIAERPQLRTFLMRHYPVPEHIAQYAERMG